MATKTTAPVTRHLPKGFLLSLFRSHDTEPRGLRTLALVGALLIPLSFLVSGAIAWKDDRWFQKPSDYRADPARTQFIPACRAQLALHGARLDSALLEQAALQRRVEALSGALKQDTQLELPLRQRLAEEQQALSETSALIEALKIDPVVDHFTAVPLLGLLIVLAFLARLLMLEHWRHVAATESPPQPPQVQHPWKAYWGFVAVWTLLLGTQHTLIGFEQEKTWFTWASLCVSPPAWTAHRFAVLGFTLLFAVPFTHLWCLSRPPPPLKLDLAHPDGHAGVSRYVLFLQTWAILSFAGALLFCILVFGYVRTQTHSLAWIYRISWMSAISTATLLAVRLVLCAVHVRGAYLSAAAKRRAHASFKPDELPPDPTIPFLGAHWWALPATIAGAATFFWALLEWLGSIGIIKG